MRGDLQRTLGANLRRHRESQGLSQEDFADALGYHRTYAGALERGERNVSLQSLETIAARIGVDPVALLQPMTPATSRDHRPRSYRRDSAD